MEQCEQKPSESRGVSAVLIRGQLRQMLKSPMFAQANRLARFLEFVVEAQLGGRAERLKESVIGVEVYDRPAGYNPKTDSIVRTEARRLRKRLQDYYEAEGRLDRVVITLPTGGYVPKFHMRPQPSPSLVSIERALDAQKQSGSTRFRAGWRLAAAVTLAMVCCFLLWISYKRSNGGEQIKSIAVLPFEAVGPAASEGLLEMGMADVIITRLGRTKKILVSPSEAVRRYSEKGLTPLAIARALRRDALLTGSIQRNGDRVRVTVQLYRASDGHTLWADQFDEKMQDIFAVEDSISQRIVAALIPNAGRLEREQLKQKYTSSIDARKLYLKGRYYWAKRTPESVQKAIDCFAGAIQLDPHYAMAYAGLADAYAVTASGLPLSERILKAKSAAAKALVIDDSLAEAHTSLAFILYKFEWAWAKAESHFRRAIELNPSYALAHHWFGEFLILRGRFDEGLAELRQAEALDPLSLPIANDVARGLYRARRYDEAIAQSRRALELDADFRNAYSTLVYAYEQKRDYAKAVGAELEVLRVSNVPAGKIAELQKVFAMSGWNAFWRSELNWMKGEKRMLPAYVSAELNTRAGDGQAAMRDLERSYEEHGDAPLLIGVEPLLDGLRRDTRFAELVRRSGVIAF